MLNNVHENYWASSASPMKISQGDLQTQGTNAKVLF